MKTLSGIFLKGLAAILPVGITIYLLYWLGTSAESLLGQAIKLLLPERFYWPGMGLAAGLALVFAVGLLANAWAIRHLFGLGERTLQQIPLVKTVYGALRDLMRFFSRSEAARFSRVVTVEVTGMRMLGLVTREQFSDLPAGLGNEDTVAVYLPMSYQIGGYTVMVPRSTVQPVDLPFQDAMRFAITAGMSVTRDPDRGEVTMKE